jgi:integrase
MSQRLVPPISEEQMKEIVSHLKDKRLRLFYLTLYYSGAREGEILAIRKEDVKIAEDEGETFGIVTINKQRTDSRKHGRNPYIIVPPKTKDSYREAIIPKELAEELLSLEQENKVLFPYGPRYVRLIWEALREKGYVPEGVTLHHLRRSRETYLINSGIPPELVANVMGHSVATALKYYKLVGATPYKGLIAKKIFGLKEGT